MVSDGNDVYVEKDGVVIMEVESAPSVGAWQYERTKPGFTGTGYYSWRSAKMETPEPLDVLEYRFRIVHPGRYKINFYSHQQGGDDVFTSLDGSEFQETLDGHGKNPDKLAWAWGMLFRTENGGRVEAISDLAAGDHTFRFAGREPLAVSRIAVYIPEKEAVALDLSTPESASVPA